MSMAAGPAEVESESFDLVRALENVQPALVLGGAMLPGVLLLVGSVAAGITSFSLPELNKQVGCFSAVNWSINYIALIPIALYFCASSLNEVRLLIRGCGEDG